MKSSRLQRVSGLSSVLFVILFALTLVTSSTAFAQVDVSSTALAQAQVREEWVARYNDPVNSNEWVSTLAVDNQGNVYVTGRISTSLGGGWYATDYATLKYDRNGTLLWAQRYNGPINGGDYATALAVDKRGNVYVTGYSWGSGTSSDYATLKYDSNGTLLWAQRYNGPGNYADEARALAVDDMATSM
jgi:hypothetical protein